MKVLRNILSIGLFTGLSVMALGAISANEEVSLLRRMLQEEREAKQAMQNYYNAKLGIGELTTSDLAEPNYEDILKEKGKETTKEKIDEQAYKAIQKLKDHLLSLLALTKLTSKERFIKVYKKAQKALEDFGAKYVEGATPETTMGSEAAPSPGTEEESDLDLPPMGGEAAPSPGMEEPTEMPGAGEGGMGLPPL